MKHISQFIHIVNYNEASKHLAANKHTVLQASMLAWLGFLKVLAWVNAPSADADLVSNTASNLYP